MVTLFSCKQEKPENQILEPEPEISLEVKCDNPAILETLNEIYFGSLLPKSNLEMYNKIYGKVDYNKYKARLSSINFVVGFHKNAESIKDYPDIYKDKELYEIVVKRIELQKYLTNYVNKEIENIPEEILKQIDEFKNEGKFVNIRPNNIDNELKKCDCNADYENIYFGSRKNIFYSGQLNSENQFFVEAYLE